MNSFAESQLDLIADALVERGYWVMDNALPKILLNQLLIYFNHLQADEFKVAGIGRQTDFQVQGTIRSDKIHWIQPSIEIMAEFLESMGSLRVGLNRRLFMGLFDYESHFAHYPIGAFYKKHLDAFRGKHQQGKSNRVLSTVLYLNHAWQPSDGGELLLYAEDDENRVIESILPEYGRLVIFLSEKFPHEVLPAKRERKSIAGWFRVNEGDL
ncbi:MAG TPA: 2OG-Fe(II) oxygenase [Cellvibrio sp.]|nr:2OG-Fe(II) oxygenase [Cellvibrio sp.]